MRAYEKLRIVVAGTGYVGLSLAVLLSQHHDVIARAKELIDGVGVRIHAGIGKGVADVPAEKGRNHDERDQHRRKHDARGLFAHQRAEATSAEVQRLMACSRKRLAKEHDQRGHQGENAYHRDQYAL